MKKVINGIIFDVIINRKKIKNIYLRLDKNTIYVNCNNLATMDKIEKVINEHEKWIIEHYQKMIDNINYRDITNGYIYILKHKYKSHIYLAKKDDVIIHDDIIDIYIKKNDIKYIEKVFYQHMDNYLYAIVDKLNKHWKEVFNKDPNFYIKKLKSKWGACYPKENKIVLSSYLIHYSKDAINSVLLHEYVHFKVFNHSKQFYDTINIYMSDYKKIAKELK